MLKKKISSYLNFFFFSFIQPLLTKDHSTEILPPILLPGETLILQQDKVTCINTLCRPATGALHLTNYRIIFTGVYMQVCEIKTITFSKK